MPAQEIVLSTHGAAAILAPNSKLSVNFDHGSAIITVLPSPSIIEEWIHFSIPSPPPEYPLFKDVSALFTHDRDVEVTGIELYQGDSQLLHKDDTIVTSATPYYLENPTEYGRVGVLASVRVKFLPTSSTSVRLTLVSVGVVAAAKPELI
ncbi:hypothetical protein VSDG_07979 [Cytospora chrysosperma]|uniref:Uncharacterized protein n=1 Tax=Cytospora chrysosperma TaxID=252740 RepID=A0A423VIR0_CYTCH|nr:hypothetical protein VSDG_07979 [Valsa sordida]